MPELDIIKGNPNNLERSVVVYSISKKAPCQIPAKFNSQRIFAVYATTDKPKFDKHIHIFGENMAQCEHYLKIYNEYFPYIPTFIRIYMAGIDIKSEEVLMSLEEYIVFAGKHESDFACGSNVMKKIEHYFVEFFSQLNRALLQN